MTESSLKGIDHTLVGVRDLEAARERWQRLGFTVTPRGRHIGWGTANYCIMFHAGYVELLGIVDPTQFTNNLDKFLETREGLMGLAFASDDPDATKERLLAAGLHPDGPQDLKRLLELPEGTVVPEFRLLFLPKEETPDLSAFVCCHLTPELVRRPEWLRHKNGASGVKGITLLTDRPLESAMGYRALFGRDCVGSTEGIARVSLAGSGDPTYSVEQLVFMTRAAFQRSYPDIGDWPQHRGALPVVTTIGVRDCEVTERVLKDAGFNPQSSFEGPWKSGCWLHPEAANGMILHFDGDR